MTFIKLLSMILIFSKFICRINERELGQGLNEKGSWHQEYKDSPYVFIGGLDYSLTEGDLRTVFSQYRMVKRVYLTPFCRYGRVRDINLTRDKDSGQSKGFAFLSYEDFRSTVLAVDNFNGAKLAGRVIRVDHVRKYRTPEELEEERLKRSKLRTKYAQDFSEELYKSAAGDYLLFPESYKESDDKSTHGATSVSESTTKVSIGEREERRKNIKQKSQSKSKSEESRKEERDRKERKRRRREDETEEERRRRKEENRKSSEGSSSKEISATK